jgi:hypothetical protein
MMEHWLPMLLGNFNSHLGTARQGFFDGDDTRAVGIQRILFGVLDALCAGGFCCLVTATYVAYWNW